MSSFDFISVSSSIGKYEIRFVSAAISKIYYVDDTDEKLVLTKIGNNTVEFVSGGRVVTHRLHPTLYYRIFDILREHYASGQNIDIVEMSSRLCTGCNFDNKYYQGQMSMLVTAYTALCGKFLDNVDRAAARDAYDLSVQSDEDAKFYDEYAGIVYINHLRVNVRREYTFIDIGGNSEWIMTHPRFACVSSINEIIDRGLVEDGILCPVGMSAIIRVSESKRH